MVYTRSRSLVCALIAALSCASCSKKQATVTSTPEQVAELAKLSGFDAEIVQTVEKESGSQAEQLMGMDDEGMDVPLNGLVVTVSAKQTEAVRRRLHDQLAPQGYKVFVRARNYGFEPDKIGVLRVDDQYDILRGLGTNGWNYNLSPGDVVAKLQEWEAQCGFEITGADFDWVEAKMTRMPADVNAFARDVYEFCPDVVEQGTGTVEALADDMRKTQTLYLWWD